jgi:hypothetical protein
MKKEEESKAVFLPAELHGRIEERAKATGFGSVDEYIIFVLEEVFKEEGDEEDRAFSEEEDEEVKKRLRALGYLD